MARGRGIAVAFTDSAKQPSVEDVRAQFFYARLKCAKAPIETGYAADELNAWAARARAWSEGNRDVYVFFINGAKERAPAAARSLIGLLRQG